LENFIPTIHPRIFKDESETTISIPFARVLAVAALSVQGLSSSRRTAIEEGGKVVSS
jgi:hypothetical protein